MNIFPTMCPSCDEVQKVVRLECPKCGLGVDGNFRLPPLAQLTAKDQILICELLDKDLSIKKLSKLLDLSFPAVRNMVDDVIRKTREILNNPEN